MRKNKGSHLRIAFSRDASDGSKRSEQPVVQQLALALPSADSILLSDVSGTDHHEFEGLLQDARPTVVWDARILPRLDLLVGPRAQALRVFEQRHMRYIDLFHVLRITSYTTAEANPTFWGGKLIELIRRLSVMGPHLVLFDNNELLDAAFMLLAPVMRITRKHELQVLRTNRAKPELMVM